MENKTILVADPPGYTSYNNVIFEEPSPSTHMKTQIHLRMKVRSRIDGHFKGNREEGKRMNPPPLNDDDENTHTYPYSDRLIFFFNFISIRKLGK